VAVGLKNKFKSARWCWSCVAVTLVTANRSQL
jgi:hypothetical protein